MDEFKFIDSIKQSTYNQASLIKGIGDDAAVFSTIGYDVVTAVDTFVEDVHFSKKTMNLYQVGYRALVANISDMAAMGASPKFYLVSIVIPENIIEEQLHQLYAGMNDLAKQYKVDLIGGDTVSGQQLTISITIIGYVQKGKARYRNEAKSKDIVFVTGTLGGSRAGLEMLLNEETMERNEQLIRTHQMPSPRVSFATSLQVLERLVLNDISDGIANELNEIAQASDVTITVEDKCIPVHDELKRFSQEKQFNYKLFGGEDFELVGTVPQKDWEFVQDAAKRDHIHVTEIGKVTWNRETNGQVFLQKDKSISLLENLGYIHLK